MTGEKDPMASSTRVPPRFSALYSIVGITAVVLGSFSTNVEALAIVSSDIHAAVFGTGLDISVIPHAGQIDSSNFFVANGSTAVRAGGVDIDLHIASLQVQATPPRPDERFAEANASIRGVSLDFVNLTDQEQEGTIIVALNWELFADTDAGYFDETAVARVSFSGLTLSRLGSTISYSYPVSELYSLEAESRLLHGGGGLAETWTARLDPNPSFSFMIPGMSTVTWAIGASTEGSVFSAIPSPATATLTLVGMAGLGFGRRRKIGSGRSAALLLRQ